MNNGIHHNMHTNGWHLLSHVAMSMLAISTMACQGVSSLSSESDHQDNDGSNETLSRVDKYKWELVPLPPDISTDIGDSPLGVLILNTPRANGRPPSEEQLAALAARVSLWTADRRRVEVDVDVVFPTPSTPTGLDGDFGERAEHERNVRIDVRPLAPLEPGWHSLELTDPGVEFLALGFTTRTEQGEERLATRFHPHAIPMFRQLRVMPAFRDKPTRVEVELTQAVPDEHATTRAKVVSDGGECQLLTTSDGSALHARIWLYECPDGQTRTLSISVVEPLHTSSGSPITTLSGETTFAIAWPDDPRWQKAGDVIVLTP